MSIKLIYFSVLDDRIEDMAQLVKDHYSIPEFSDPSAATEVSPLPPYTS